MPRDCPGSDISASPGRHRSRNRFDRLRKSLACFFSANPSRKLIFDYGEKENHVFVLLQGGVWLHLPAKPEEFRIVISKVASGELFELSSLLGFEHYILEAKCAESGDILIIHVKIFRNLLETNSPAGFIIE
jgi:hypothetical protein